MPDASDKPAQSGVVIRMAMPEHLPALLKLEEVFGADGLNRRSMFDFVRSSSARVFVAVVDGHVVGDAIVLRPRRRRRARLYSLVTDPAHQGRGIASALLRHCENWVHAEGREGLTLEVRCDNRNAIALYQRMLYSTVEAVPRYYADGMDALRMFKRLCL